LSSAVEFYGALTSAPAQIRADLRETELRLQIERAQIRSELTRDIEQVRLDLSVQIECLRTELKTDIGRVKLDIIKWITPLMIAQLAAIAAPVKPL